MSLCLTNLYRIFFSFLLVIFGGEVCGQGKIIFVNVVTGSPAGDGSTTLPYTSIQKAIDTSRDKDTVLVARGTYYENVDLKGKKIVLASNYLFSKDTSDIQSTIIDGSYNGNTVQFINGETKATKLIGFKIIRGKSGIAINSTSPHLTHLIISQNSSLNSRGSAISAVNNCSFLLEHSLIEGNNNSNGVISVGNIYSDSSYVIRNTIMRNNSGVSGSIVISDGKGGGLFENVLIEADGASCIGYMNTNNGLRIVNSTLYSRGGSALRNLYNNTYESKVIVVNSILATDHSGYQLTLNNAWPRTSYWIYNCALKGGLATGVQLFETTRLVDVGGEVYDTFSFKNELGHDYRLPDDSPLVGSGAVSYYFKGLNRKVPEYDLNQQIRPSPLGSSPDIGAYEVSAGGSASLPPVLSTYSPTQATVGSEIVIRGDHLDGALSVFFGDQPASSYQVVSSTEIHAKIGQGLSGDVVVRTKYGSAKLSGFKYIETFPSLRNTRIHVSTTGEDFNSVGYESSPFRNIQTAINYSQDGDTILVARGVYYENLVMRGKKIVLASHYLMSKDTSDIRATEINGGGKGDVIQFTQGENHRTRLVGFKISNGWYGLLIDNVNPRLSHLIITGCRNVYGSRGSAISAVNNCSFLLEHSLIEGNNNSNGVISVGNIYSDSSYVIRNTIMRNNSGVSGSIVISDGKGGGLFENVLIEADGASCIGYMNTNNGLRIVNSTLYSRGGSALRNLYNNTYESKVIVVNSILTTDHGNYTLSLNNGVPATSYWFMKTAIKGGLSGVQFLPTTLLRDSSVLDFQNSEFVNVSEDNFRLSNVSDKLGSGTLHYQYLNQSFSIPEIDLDGYPRPSPAGTLPDLGAYENRTPQVVTFGSLSAKIYGDPSFVLNASSNYSLPITYTSSNTSVATLVGSTITLVGSGTTIITAAQDGNSSYPAAIPVSQTLTVDKAILTVKADNKSRNYKDENLTFTLTYSGFKNNETASVLDVAPTASTTATSSSPVGTYPIVVSGGQDNNYIFSYQAGVLTITPAMRSQTITFSTLNDVLETVGTFTLSATSSSGLPVTFTSSNTSRLTISGNTATIIAPGKVTITAVQAGDNEYAAAASVSQTICINPKKPTYTATGLGTERVVLTSSSASGNQWYKNDQLLNDQTTNTLAITTNGTYKLKTVIDGCASEFSEPFTFLITAAADEQIAFFTIYPNPVKNELRVQLPHVSAQQTSELMIFDQVGRVVGTTKITGSEGVIFVGDYSPGSYVLKLNNPHQVGYKRFIKQ